MLLDKKRYDDSLTGYCMITQPFSW